MDSAYIVIIWIVLTDIVIIWIVLTDIVIIWIVLIPTSL